MPLISVEILSGLYFCRKQAGADLGQSTNVQYVRPPKSDGRLAPGSVEVYSTVVTKNCTDVQSLLTYVTD
jgi:hypothetical protein